MVNSVGGTHDIRIGSSYFLLRPGAYQKRSAPLFGARFATGDPDYTNLNFWQHWAQTCWVGGFGADTWSDDAMFDEGVGVDTSQHEVMLLSRDLGPADRVTGNWDLDELDGPRFRQFFAFNDKLYVLTGGGADTGTPPSRVYRFTDATSTWTLIYTFTTGIRVQSWEAFAGYLVFGSSGTTMYRMSSAEVFTTFAKPAVTALTERFDSLKTYRGKLYATSARAIWRLNADFTWDGSTAFYTAESVDFLQFSDVHLGYLYFSSVNGHILRTDGNNTFDMWAFEPSVTITYMRSFDGKLFIATADDQAGTDVTEAVLYQFSGSAVTELKRWGRLGYNISPGRLRVIGRSLWFGAERLLGMGDKDGFGIARYDPIEDAFHLFASNLDSVTYAPGTAGVNLIVDDVAYWRGYVYCSVRSYGIFRTKFSFSDASRELASYDTTPAGGSVASLNGGWYTSSDFDAGTPGLLKLWNAITLHVDLPTAAQSVFVEYSIDGGETWKTVGSLAGNGTTTRYAYTWTLNDGAATAGPLRATRLKYRITLRTTSTASTPQLRGVVVRYVPMPEPNWVWDLTIVLSDTQLLHDGTVETADIGAKLVALETLFRAGNLVEFQDIDGVVWAGAGQPGVLLMDMVQLVPLITASADGAREREVRLVIHEAVESYS